MKLKILEIKKIVNLNLILVGLLAFIAVTSPFWHIFFEKGAQDGIFGFKSMRSFLYSFGTHFILLGASLFMFWFIYQIKEIERSLKRIANILSGMFCSVSIYYLLYIFISPSSNSPYPDILYEVIFILLSILISYFIFLVFNFQKIKKKDQAKFDEESKKFEKSALAFINEINDSLVSES